MPKSKSAAAAPKKVTAASAWKRSAQQTEGVVVTMPSGNVARLRRTLDLPLLLRTGKIPNPLAGYVDAAIKTKNPAIKPSEGDNEAMVQMVVLIQTQLPRIFIEPRVEIEPKTWDTDTQGVWEPSEDALRIEDIDPEDAMFAFAFAQGGPAEVASFREQQATIVANMAHEQGVEGEAKQPAGS